MHKIKQALITGATGFLGGYVVDEFQRHGYSIVATGRDPRKLASLESDQVRTVQCRLDQLGTLKEPVDIVVHAAALSSPWGTWDQFQKHNVDGTQRVIDFCLANGTKRLVYVSSPSIYSGWGHRYAIREDDYDPTNHLNHYIRSKIMAEKLIRQAQNQGLETVIVRPRGLFGVGDSSIIPRLLRANDKIGIPLFDHGRNLVDVTCVENVALGLRLACEKPAASGQVYNLTNGEPRQFKQILDAVFGAIGKTPRYRHMNVSIMYALAGVTEAAYRILPIRSEPMVTKYTAATLAFSQTLDISMAQHDLGFKPTLTLDEGIRRYAADYKQHHS